MKDSNLYGGKPIVSILFLFLYSIAILFLAFIPIQSDFLMIVLGFGIAFSIYFYWVKEDFNQFSFSRFLILAIVIRIVLIFSFPNFSDDIYRFVWDGKLVLGGINPYSILPSEYIMHPTWVSGINQVLYENLNSQNYYTIYPPICQLIFAVPAALSIESLYWNSVCFKSIFFLAELSSISLLIKLLKSQNINHSRVFIYALNPLIIIEIMGNIHFEGIMIFFLVCMYFAILKKSEILTGISFVLSVASKLVPLIFAPLLIATIKPRNYLSYYVLPIVLFGLLFTPILISFNLINFGDSLDLYFRKFEFNASLYFLFRFIGIKIMGYNLIQYIGPILSIVSFILIMFIYIKNWKTINTVNFPFFAVLGFTIYLLFSTTIHPWYLAVPILFSIFINTRFILVWSAVIVLSYATYQNIPYSENLWLVGVEYTILIAFFLKEKSLALPMIVKRGF